jgi:cephalosporin hydroxylase
MSDQGIIDAFHKLYYSRHAEIWKKTLWLGVPALKLPQDLWTYQEILMEVKPDLIIETGTFLGGSAYFMASVCDLLKNGRIISVDIEAQPGRPQHPRITYLRGSSTAPEVVGRMKLEAEDEEKVLVILDSHHGRDHVLEEMEFYGRMVSPGSYLIVEDGNINGHPVFPEFGPGPTEAIQSYLRAHPEFEVDHSREKFLVTFNPGGYLKKK